MEFPGLHPRIMMIWSSKWRYLCLRLRLSFQAVLNYDASYWIKRSMTHPSFRSFFCTTFLAGSGHPVLPSPTSDGITQHSRFSGVPPNDSILPIGLPYSRSGVPCARAEICNPLTAVKGNIRTLVDFSETLDAADCCRCEYTMYCGSSAGG